MRRGTRGLARILILASCCPLAGLAIGPTPGHAAPAGQNCAPAGQDSKVVPWQQQMLGPERVWPLGRGTQVSVAVLASGVDANQPQLRGRVAAGFDAVTGVGVGNDDCLGTGTQVAGVIVGQRSDATSFVGLAPGATILPIRVVAGGILADQAADPRILARGITWAVDHGADIIDVAVPAYTDSPELRDAVARAQSRNVIVVAAIGNLGNTNGVPPQSYPAPDDGVIGVGAVDQNGVRWIGSQTSTFVDLAAPGAQVITLQRGQGLTLVDGTGVASGFVAATVALARGRLGGNASSADVIRQVVATATPAPGGPHSIEYGAGVVNPYAAVTEQLANGRPAALPALHQRSAAREQAWAHSRRLAAVGAAVAALAVLVVLMVALALPRGRRRFWRAGIAPAPASRPEPEPGPPLMLFDEASPQR